MSPSTRGAGDGGNVQGRPAAEQGGPSACAPPRGWRRRVRRLGIYALVLVVVLAICIGGAEYYTAKPSFCGSCHIMIPYYKSWSHDRHATEFNVACVRCHYAPGTQHTFKAKFRGLSQLTSYFSGRAGASRPRAHVSDASCLTSDCHGNETYLAKSLAIGVARTEKRFVNGHETEVQRTPTVHFVHEKHLRVDARMEEASRHLDQVRARLTAMLPAPAMESLARLAVSGEPVEQRTGAIKTLVHDAGVDGAESDAIDLAALEHLQTRLRQLAGLSCAACHTYDASGSKHITVEQQACFVCHFTNQAFNRHTGACLTCHEPPTRKIAVHEAAGGAPGTGIMDHQEIVRRNIDCASCHLDVIQGTGRVTARECTHCHDQERYMVDFAGRTTRDIEFYHRTHSALQRARCPDCHGVVQHQLASAITTETAEGFLAPVLDNCKHCHPNHHHEQTSLLAGIGAEGLGPPMPNAMFGSRINCRACHTQPGSDFKGAPLIQATAATCVQCHTEEYRSLLDRWINELDTRLKETSDSLDRLEKRIEQARVQGRAIPARVEEIVKRTRHNLELVRIGDGIHNRNYALNVFDLGNAEIAEAEGLLPGS